MPVTELIARQRSSIQRPPSPSGSRGRAPHPPLPRSTAQKLRVLVIAENRLLLDALVHLLIKRGAMDATGMNSPSSCLPNTRAEYAADVLLLASRGNLAEDLATVKQIRASAPALRVLFIGMAQEEADFLQCVRAGISGYLPRDASADEVLEGVRAVHTGKAVCPGSLCSTLFRYFEREASALPRPGARKRFGLTRREQQLMPLVAQGLTNKEIATHFSLSEQTVKNHLYRMKHKIGAEDRFEMAHFYHTQSFLL